MIQQSGIVAEILRNKFGAVIDDMRATLVNTAYSAAIARGRECAAAIFTESGELIDCDSVVHMCSLSETVAQVIEYFKYDMTANDVIITNDPYSGGTRVQDFTLVAPIAHEDEIVMYAAVRARMADIGGELLGSLNPLAQEIWGEGARITPVKLVRDGKLQKDVLTTILLNSRMPEALRLDLDAMMAAINIGKLRLAGLFGSYGNAAVVIAARWALEYAERRLAAEIAAWPKGEYHGASRLQHDCQGREDLAVRVTMRVAEGALELDFAQSDQQSSGFANSTRANTFSYALVALLSVIDESIPRNSGLLRRIALTTRKGTIVDAEFPAPTGWSNYHAGCEIVEAMTSALAEFLPARVANVAASIPLADVIAQAVNHGGTIEQVAVFDYAAFCQGDCGAAEGRDGWGLPGIFAQRPLPSAEIHEIEVGNPIASLEFATDSGGAGQWRGGPGNELKVWLGNRPEDLRLNLCIERSDRGIERQAGGRTGARCDAQLVVEGKATSIERTLVNAPIGPGTALIMRMSGGAGWGLPYQRDAEAVLRDVLDQYVSLQAAHDDYGVVIRPDSMIIDVDATRRRRSELAATAARQ
ncbi:MAG TPA: hydantoinase B/oxoprolinase family protein [Candidatus Binataceae bacterium]|nr:hydantoinase B/oxoprolinase family protein [Candidatus Binataceae bacterium]